MVMRGISLAVPNGWQQQVKALVAHHSAQGMNEQNGTAAFHVSPALIAKEEKTVCLRCSLHVPIGHVYRL